MRVPLTQHRVKRCIEFGQHLCALVSVSGTTLVILELDAIEAEENRPLALVP